MKKSSKGQSTKKCELIPSNRHGTSEKSKATATKKSQSTKDVEVISSAGTATFSNSFISEGGESP